MIILLNGYFIKLLLYVHSMSRYSYSGRQCYHFNFVMTYSVTDVTQNYLLCMPERMPVHFRTFYNLTRDASF